MEDKIISPQSKRLKLFINKTGFSYSEFARQCKIPQPRSITSICSNGKVPTAKILEKIIKRFPQLNYDWVVLGYGEMIVKGIQNQATDAHSLQKSQTATYENIQQYLHNHDFAINELANMIKKAMIANTDTLNTFHNKIANYEESMSRVSVQIKGALDAQDSKLLSIKEGVKKDFMTVVNAHKDLIHKLDNERTERLDKIQSEVRQNWSKYEAKIDKDLAVFGKKIDEEFNNIKKIILNASEDHLNMTNDLDAKRLKYLNDKFKEITNDIEKKSDANTKKALDFVSQIGDFKKHSNPKPEK